MKKLIEVLQAAEKGRVIEYMEIGMADGWREWTSDKLDTFNYIYRIKATPIIGCHLIHPTGTIIKISVCAQANERTMQEILHAAGFRVAGMDLSYTTAKEIL